MEYALELFAEILLIDADFHSSLEKLQLIIVFCKKFINIISK